MAHQRQFSWGLHATNRHMGEANKAYVNQEYDEAIRLCQHVLTQYPYAPEPYTTLAMVHQDRGDIRTALEFRKLEAVRLRPATHIYYRECSDYSLCVCARARACVRVCEIPW